MKSRCRHPRRGFFLTDTIVGIGILVVLSITLTAAMVQFRKGAERLSSTRAAERLAEQTLLCLQSGQTAPKAGEHDSIEVLPLPASETHDLPPRCFWARVRATHNGRVVELIGVIPSDMQRGEAR